MDATVQGVIESAMNDTIEGGVLVGTLANGGVDLAPFHDMEKLVPDNLKAELTALRQSIIDGTVKVAP